MTGRNMRLRFPEGMRSVVDADLTLTGTMEAPTLGGDTVHVAAGGPLTLVNVWFASWRMTHTAIKRPPASAMAVADTIVETRCWRRLL